MKKLLIILTFFTLLIAQTVVGEYGKYKVLYNDEVIKVVDKQNKTEITQKLDSESFKNFKERVFYKDYNFDGVKDFVILNGWNSYSGYLYKNGKFVFCKNLGSLFGCCKKVEQSRKTKELTSTYTNGNSGIWNNWVYKEKLYYSFNKDRLKLTKQEIFDWEINQTIRVTATTFNKEPKTTYKYIKGNKKSTPLVKVKECKKANLAIFKGDDKGLMVIKNLKNSIHTSFRLIRGFNKESIYCTDNSNYIYIDDGEELTAINLKTSKRHNLVYYEDIGPFTKMLFNKKQSSALYWVDESEEDYIYYIDLKNLTVKTVVHLKDKQIENFKFSKDESSLIYTIKGSAKEEIKRFK